MKRSVDIVLALIGLSLFAPVLIAIAVAIKVSSPGPVFYRGVRTGRHGKPFRILKFRSMIVNAEKVGGSTTGKNDPRVTRIGRVLRTYKLDELPQLLNVLMGNMSFVGPRPEVKEYTDLYNEKEKAILSVRPGITDLSSIKFHDLQSHVGSEDPDRFFREKILPQKNALRLRYVSERSFRYDVSILLRTVFVLATKPLKRNS